jgi:hypothetical protein
LFKINFASGKNQYTIAAWQKFKLSSVLIFIDVERFFLYRVYRHNKKLFFLFVFFAGATIACNLMGNEITPFYVWGMYSEKKGVPKEYAVLKSRRWIFGDFFSFHHFHCEFSS